MRWCRATVFHSLSFTFSLLCVPSALLFFSLFFFFFLLLLGVPFPLPFFFLPSSFFLASLPLFPSLPCSSSFLLSLPRFPPCLLFRITCQLDLSHFCDIQPSHKQDELSAGSVLMWERSCVGGAWITRRGRTHQISAPLLFSAVAPSAARARTQTR